MFNLVIEFMLANLSRTLTHNYSTVYLYNTFLKWRTFLQLISELLLLLKTMLGRPVSLTTSRSTTICRLCVIYVDASCSYTFGKIDISIDFNIIWRSQVTPMSEKYQIEFLYSAVVYHKHTKKRLKLCRPMLNFQQSWFCIRTPNFQCT